MSLFVLILLFVTTESSIYKRVNIFGPGLKPEKIVMPARYFFVDCRTILVNKTSDDIKHSLHVSIAGRYSDKRGCRIQVSILDRKDGVFVIRYKLFETCNNLQISVKLNETHLGSSPYNYEEIIYPEECYCPNESFEDWLNEYECHKISSNYSQIHNDLEPFPTVDFDSFHMEFLKKFDHPGSMSICNYVVLNNQVYRKCYGEHVGFKMFMDAILLSLARKARLPDIEMFVNLGDWPLVKIEAKSVYPLFSWCGSESTYDIVMPTYDITESSLQAMGRVSLDMLSVQGNANKIWAEREAKAFWRGRDSSRERLKLIDISRQHPDLINASLVNFFFFRHLENQYGPKTNYISFFKFFDYKFQINLDGTVAAYRFPYLLSGRSLVLKQDSEYYEHFYKALKPKHYFIPIKRDLSNLVKKLKWAKENDKKAEKIARNGQKFAEENLLPQNIFCYHAVLLQEWKKRIVSKVTIREGMELVSQPEESVCTCEKKTTEESKFRDEL